MESATATAQSPRETIDIVQDFDGEEIVIDILCYEDNSCMISMLTAAGFIPALI